MTGRGGEGVVFRRVFLRPHGPVAVVARKVRRARALSAADWRLLGRAGLALLEVQVALRLLPFDIVQRRMSPRRPVPAPPPSPLRRARIAAAVDRAARNMPLPATCLPRALVLSRLLAAAGFPAEVRIGVRREGATLLAHAWVESAGEVVGDRPDVATLYPPLAPPARLPGGAVVTNAGLGDPVCNSDGEPGGQR